MKNDTRNEGPRDAGDTAFAPTPQELERLLFAIESAAQVNKRFQFFLWAQGVLQSFLPHAKLISVFGDLVSKNYRIDVFSADSVNELQSHHIDPAIGTLVELALNQWNETGRAPLLYSSDAQLQAHDDPLVQAIWELGLGNLIAHGTRDVQNNQACFFIFGRLPKAAQRRTIDVLEILLPHLYFAVLRCAGQERLESAPATLTGPVLSLREVQIMQGVRDGKTNSDIGLALDISPLTVKNHVQRILRKLEVSNRIQAVTKCMRMGVFDKAQRK